MSVLPKSSVEKGKKYGRFIKYSMENFQKEIRKDFKKRLKDFRHEKTDKNRCIFDLEVQKEFEKIKNHLVEDEAANEFMDQIKLLELLDDIQKEILQEELQQQADHHLKEAQAEMNSIFDHLSSTCSVCEKHIKETFYYSNVICDNCTQHFDMTFKPN